MTSIAKYRVEIDKLEYDMVARMDEIFIKAGMEAFVLWATAFPKRDLRFVSGMGTATFACPTLDRSCFLLDLDDYCEGNIRKSFWNPRAAAMVQPMREFWELFWCGDFYQHPSIPDIIYDSKRRTVKCGDNIIQLDEYQA